MGMPVSHRAILQAMGDRLPPDAISVGFATKTVNGNVKDHGEV